RRPARSVVDGRQSGPAWCGAADGRRRVVATAAAAAEQSQRDRRAAARDAAAIAQPQGRVRARLRLRAAQGLRTGGAGLPRLRRQVSEREARVAGPVLARLVAV